MSKQLQCISPIDGSVYAERAYADPQEIEEALARATGAQEAWRALPLERRIESLSKAVDLFEAERQDVGEEITRSMGRPIKASPKETDGFAERARYMLEVAPEELAEMKVAEAANKRQFIRREALGVALVLVPWNYPYMTAVNTVWPALAAGNAVIHKPSAQTPLSAERFARVLAEAGAPDGVLQAIHIDRATTAKVVQDRRINVVAFTGSVSGGRAVQGALDGNFPGLGLELGGKDPAYVRADADLEQAVDGTVDGAFFNSGQSCCALERLYVHADIYDSFVERFVAAVNDFVLDDPMKPETSLGPMVRTEAAEFVRAQVAAAIKAGAKAHIDPASFPKDGTGTPYLAPQVLTEVDHSMAVMTEETFGPVIGIKKVGSDEEAIGLMNESDFGLTAAVFTRDLEAAAAIGEELETGTVFANKSDYLDPALAWVGVKDSGRGCTLSRLGYGQLTRPKSFNLHR